MLKADIHLHTREDIADRFIQYDAFTLIERAAAHGFSVLSITNHDQWTYTERLRDFAAERGILLIPGIEMTVQGKHVLAYATEGRRGNMPGNIADLRRFKGRETLFVAPHPYYPSSRSLGKALTRWRDLFDAVELCHLYTRHLNYNRRALRTAAAFNLPVIGTSDCHVLRQLNTTYTLIDAAKDTVAIFDAIKCGNIAVVSSPLTLCEIARIIHGIMFRHAAGGIVRGCRDLCAAMRRVRAGSVIARW